MDLNVQAFRIVGKATSELAEREKLASSRKGGLKGGHARAQAMSPERRTEIARKASEARWQKKFSEHNADGREVE